MTDRPQAALALDPKVVGDIFPPDVLDRLRRVVRLAPGPAISSFEKAADLIAEVEILVTGWGCPVIDDAALDAAPRLRAVVHAAGSVKTHVRPEVYARGIVVSSAAEANAIPVAEYTIAALVLAAKQVFAKARTYGAGELAPGWAGGEDTGIYGTTIGVVGASRIGRLVLERLPAFTSHVLVADPYLTPSAAGSLGAELVELDELCRRSDLVTIHAPQLPETYQMFDKARLALLRDGAVVVNTSRGSLVDTAALTDECARGRLSAVLDVTDPEPLPVTHPLHGLPNVLITPHLAGARGRELRRIGEFAVAEVERVVRGEPLRGQVLQDDLARIA